MNIWEQEKKGALLPDFFEKQKEIFLCMQKWEERKKLTVSGLPNISAKLFFLRKFFQEGKKEKNILFVFPNRNEVHEAILVAPLFFSGETHMFHLFSEEVEKREREKIEWTLLLLKQKKEDKKHIFFCTSEQALEAFPHKKDLQDQKTILTKKQKISPLQLFNELTDRGYTLTNDLFLQKGEYRRSGNIIDVFPIGRKKPIKIEIAYDTVESITEFSLETKKIGEDVQKINLYPCSASEREGSLGDLLTPEDIQIWNELEEITETSSKKLKKIPAKILKISSFPENEETSVHLRFLSVLKFYNLPDLLLDFREKEQTNWKTLVLTKRKDELKNILTEKKISFSENTKNAGILLLDTGELEAVPPSFQNPEEKMSLLTDREIFHLSTKKKKSISSAAANIEFLTSLKVGDLVVHLDHGIGRFLGIGEQEIDGHIREYLEISYLHEDKLFVPVDQADKISRFITEESREPKLTRLGGVEWKNIQKKVKRETEKIAKELLDMYAKRAQVKGLQFGPDTERQEQFEKNFPYEETPGQITAIRDTKTDLESTKPMDRLLCGDVGFGKTEVAMRAAFKVADNQKQVALIAPITILVQQHYETFQKRMNEFGVTVEMLSRFRTPAQQKKILQKLKKGTIDIIIGTHRLLSDDVEFYDLGLVIIDEEQRFGVKQKEKFKDLRSEVSILTLSATPIPRTLNLALHKLRDITTITTPPPGRLPIITEVRKYSDHLIREAILKEKKRRGQIYFLHNRVETIESMAEKLRLLVPEATFAVGHGQMKAEILEDRILSFKEKKYDVLVSSTIIENGIDLANANTLIVNNAENFGLAQLYQLRGRIGRSPKQAYAYLLHSSQKLSLNAKKRLKALIEASELGSGFQLSMRDLEIRGAGDVLGVSQHGTVNVVGVSHFLRLLNKTIKQMQEGKMTEKDEEVTEVLIEIPLDAYIPGTYIANTKEKILMYQKLAAVQNHEKLHELVQEMAEEYGRMPVQVKSLFEVLDLKISAREAGVKAIKIISSGKKDQEVQLHLSKKVTAAEIMNLLKYQSYWMISGEMVKTDIRKLGFHWTEKIKEALGTLKKQKIQKRKKQQRAGAKQKNKKKKK